MKIKVLGILLLLCGFAGAQQTFCSAQSNCTVTGAWTFSGPTTLPSVTLFRGRIDASTFAGADMCAKVNAAWTYAAGLGLGYGEVDATGFHGRQDVATNCFASFPITPTAPQRFMGYLKLAPDVKIVTSVAQNPPSDIIIDGGSIWAWPVTISSVYTTQMGAQFIAANGFDYGTQQAVMVLGFAGGSTNPRGIWLQNLGVNCIGPNGTYVSGSIGIYNGLSQENTGGDHVGVNGCNTDIKLENDGTFTGSQNSGPWNNLVLNSVGVPTTATTWKAFDYCSATGLCKNFRGVHGATIAGPTGGAVGSIGISVNAGLATFTDISCEEVSYCVELGTAHAVKGATLSGITGQGHTDFNIAAVIHVPATAIASFTAFNIGSAEETRSDYIIRDESTGGLSLCGQSSTTVGSPCNGATKLTPNLSFYTCSFQTGYGVTRQCLWNTPEQQGFGTPGSEATSSANLTLDLTHFAQNVIMNPTTSAGITATLPATIPNKNWYTTITNGSVVFPLFISPNGKNLNGNTVNWTVPPQTSCFVTTQGTSYHATCGSQNSMVNLPNVLTFSQTTSTGDQNITCHTAANLCPAGMYRITVHVTVTAAATAGTMQPYCGYKDASATIHNPVNATPLGLGTTSMTTIGNSYAGECVVESDGTSNLKFGVTLTGATGTPTIRVNAAAERISIQ